MNKIVGFLISKDNHSFEFDVFNVGLNSFVFKHLDFFIKVWGIGEFKDLVKDDYFSLSFLKSKNLLDRNVLIRFNVDSITIENDWLGSIPVFYNPETHIVSTLPNLCLTSNDIDEEGLGNYFEFGYSVFEKTPFKSVKFLRYYSKIELSNSGLLIEYKPDPVLDDDFISTESNEQEVIDLMRNYISEIESKVEGDIILPTSGGYDSRILNYLVKDKKRIKSFTYGISKSQSDSYEVVHAKKISEIIGTDWKQVPLTDFHKYIDHWFKIYGPSTHLHGMYHIEFYMKILEENKFNLPTFISGIFGDIWAGSVSYKKINNHCDLINLGYTHGMKLDDDFIILNKLDSSKKEFYKKNCQTLNNDKLKAVTTVRMKISLISYLTQIPEYFGLPVWTPFLNYEIVKATINIDDERRKDRVWQRDFFRKVDLNLEDMNLKSSKQNKLNYEVARRRKLEPLDVDLMSKYVNEVRLIDINNTLSQLSFFQNLKNQLLFIPKIGGLLRCLGFRNEFLIALNEYYVIKSVEKGLKYDA